MLKFQRESTAFFAANKKTKLFIFMYDTENHNKCITRGQSLYMRNRFLC